MRSLVRVCHNVTRICITFNSQRRTGVIVNCLQSHTLQTGSVRLLSKNVVLEVSKCTEGNSLSRTIAIPDILASLQWVIMKVKGKKRKESSSSGIKKKQRKRKVKKSKRKSKSKSAKVMADPQPIPQPDAPGGTDDSDIEIVFEGQRLPKEPSHKQRQASGDDDDCVVISIGDIPLPQERIKDVGSIPLPNGEGQLLTDTCIQDGTAGSQVPNDRNQDAEDRNDTIRVYDYESEVKEGIARLQKIRKWENTLFGSIMEYSDRGMDGIQFTVMSYNVLAQGLLENHRSLYGGNDMRALTWEHRSRTLMNEFRAANADVLCLQEVQEDHLAWYNSQLSDLGYEGLYKKRTNMHLDGCAIYFKRHRFRLVESSSVEYYQPGVQVLDRDNVGLIARLEVIGTEGQQLVVATTHLLFNPRRHDIKLAQMQLLLAELERICYYKFDDCSGEPLYRPVILTGDLNLQPYTAVYRFLTDGFINYSILSERTLQSIEFGYVQESLLPPDLNVSNTCQHLDVVRHRRHRRLDSDEALREELRLLKPFNADNMAYLKKHEPSNPNRSFREFVKNGKRDGYINNFAPNLHSSCAAGGSSSFEIDGMRHGLEPGMLSHCFHFKSVYKHKVGRGPAFKIREATTHQQGWVTVDYMFYSGRWNQRSQMTVEGPLKLVSRYGLPTEEQCRECIKHIPNMACGSDHLPLMARFLLRR